MQLLAASKGKLELGAALLVEIDLQRHQRLAFLGHGCCQLGDLALVQQQAARAARLVVEAVGLKVFRQIGIIEPDLTVFLRRVGVLNVGLAAAQGFHFRAAQLDADFQNVLDLIVEPRLPVVRNNRPGGAARLGRHGHIFPAWTQKGHIPALPVSLSTQPTPPSSSRPSAARAGTGEPEGKLFFSRAITGAPWLTGPGSPLRCVRDD